MKKAIRLFLLLPVFSVFFAIKSKAELLIFEYGFETSIHGIYGGECCYYILVLDTARKEGVFCSSYCHVGHPGLEFLKTRIRYNYNEEKMIYYPVSYVYETSDLIRHRYDDSTWMKNPEFHFGYYIKDNWTRLEHTAFYFNRNEKKKRKQKRGKEVSIGAWSHIITSTISMSDFLTENEVNWFPPYMNRVEQLDIDKVAKYYKSDFENCIKGRF